MCESVVSENMNYLPHTEHHWREFQRTSRLPLHYFDHTRPRYLRVALVVLFVALVCVACAL